jgi:PRTRC genetic system protein B
MSVLSDYRLTAVLAIYKSEPVASHDSGPLSVSPFHRSYVEIHRARRGRDGEAVLGAGKPLSLRALKAIAARLGKEVVAEHMGLLPERVLAVRPDGGLLWWLPAARRELVRKDKPTAQAWWPPLVFMQSDGLSVFALREDGRPGPKAKLYRAPFWNVGPDGGACMGSGRVRTHGTAAERVESAEQAFITVPFSHELGSGGLVKGKSLDAVWGGLVASRRKFPAKELVLQPNFKTLADLAGAKGF